MSKGSRINSTHAPERYSATELLVRFSSTPTICPLHFTVEYCFGGGTSFCRTRFGIHPMARQQLHDQRNQMGLLRWWNSSCWDSPHYYRMAVIAALPGGDWAFKSCRQGGDRH